MADIKGTHDGPVSKCPRCLTSISISRLLAFSGLPIFRCEGCGRELRWRRPHVYVFGPVMLVAFLLGWWHGLRQFGDMDEPQLHFMILPWTMFTLAVYVYIRHTWVPVELADSEETP